jgi:hypothetical protein
MAKLYNQRDIMQECSKRLTALRGESRDAWSVHDHLEAIYTMISKLAEYKDKE